MMRYTVVKNYNFTDFLDDVDRLIMQGWVLQGGIGVTIDHDNDEDHRFLYAQALFWR